MISHCPELFSLKSEEFPKTLNDLFNEDDSVALDQVKQDMHAFEADSYTLEELDEYVTASVMMSQGGESIQAKLVG